MDGSRIGDQQLEFWHAMPWGRPPQHRCSGYPLHALPAARTVSWPALYAQFGSSYKKLAHFKMRFIDSLKVATAVYRQADVELEEKGLILRPSKPPVAPRIVAVGGKLIARVQSDHIVL
jgi:hypothetical protein